MRVRVVLGLGRALPLARGCQGLPGERRTPGLAVGREAETFPRSREVVRGSSGRSGDTTPCGEHTLARLTADVLPTYTMPRVSYPRGSLPMVRSSGCLAPRGGLEPPTYRLTAGCSTIELPRKRVVRAWPTRSGVARDVIGGGRRSQENRGTTGQKMSLRVPRSNRPGDSGSVG